MGSSMVGGPFSPVAFLLSCDVLHSNSLQSPTNGIVMYEYDIKNLLWGLQI